MNNRAILEKGEERHSPDLGIENNVTTKEYIEFREKESAPFLLKEGEKSRRLYLAVKRVADIVVSILALLIMSPLMLITMLVVMVDNLGAPFYISERVGKDGRTFKIYKFRSMKVGADLLEEALTPEELAKYESEYKLDHDPRVTRVGNVLRKTSIDELPQLINIIKGDLSLVGPRPILQRETEL